MVGKKIPNQLKGSSKSARIQSLLRYMEKPENENAEEKCAYKNGINFIFDSTEAQKAEMIALATESKRSADPIYHFVLSWPESEMPTTEQCDDSVRIVLAHLGMADHQCRYALHLDTNDTHLHLAVNRVHPHTHKVRHIYHDVDRLHEAVALIEHKFGFEPEKNARFVVNDAGEIIPTTDSCVPRKETKLSAKARSIEVRTGGKSAERICQENALPVIEAAQSWRQLHEELEKLGIRYSKKGSGAILEVGDQAIKASTAGRFCALSKVEERLGPYVPSECSSVPMREPEPLRKDAPRWSEYRLARQEYRRKRAEQFKELRTRQQDERRRQHTTHKAARTELLSRGTWSGQGPMLNAFRSVLAKDQAAEKAQLRQRQHVERKTLRAALPAFPCYNDWLLQHAPKAAQQWRYMRSEAESDFAIVTGDALLGEEKKIRDIRSFVPTIDQRTGRVLYARTRGELDFVDRGKVIDIYNWRDEQTTLAALQLSAQKWGAFQVFGSDEYKIMCVRLAAEHGFKILNPELQEQLAQERLSRRASLQEVCRGTPEKASESAKSPAKSTEELYHRHRDDIRRKIHTVIDPSRVDWMIAVRLRATGHLQGQIEAALEACARQERNHENRDWSKYAKHTVNGAFGEKGNRELVRMKNCIGEWRRLEGRRAELRRTKRSNTRDVQYLGRD